MKKSYRVAIIILTICVTQLNGLITHQFLPKSTARFFPEARSYAAGTQLNTWINPDGGMEAAISDLVTHAQKFTWASPLLARATCNSITKYGNYTPALNTVMSQLHNAGLHAQLTVQGRMNPVDTLNCFTNPVTEQQHINALVNTAKSSGADGIDIDYEQAYSQSTREQAGPLRAAYIDFMTKLCSALHAAQKSCAIAVLGTNNGMMHRSALKGLPDIFDYSALGRVADRVEIMAYDQHSRLGAPGPIAGMPWVAGIARYAAATIPAQKVWLGVPLYGRDWVNNSGTTLKNLGAAMLLNNPTVQRSFDPVQGELHLRYRGLLGVGAEHDAWYPTIDAVRLKINLARQYGFAVGFWSIGQEIPGTFEQL